MIETSELFTWANHPPRGQYKDQRGRQESLSIGIFYIPKDLHKTRRFYKFILVDTKSVKITHISSRNDPSKIVYSK